MKKKLAVYHWTNSYPLYVSSLILIWCLVWAGWQAGGLAGWRAGGLAGWRAGRASEMAAMAGGKPAKVNLKLPVSDLQRV